jgi:ADP-ribosylglycohydrolase
MDKQVIRRAQGCLLGQLAGDSLGALVEFKTAEKILRLYPHGVRNLADGGVWNTLAGQPTDDSEMALALARSLVKEGSYNRPSVRAAYVDWLRTNSFGCGRTVAKALGKERLDPKSQANGALMRISPLGIFGARLAPDGTWAISLDTLALWADQDASLTHIHPLCRQAGILFTVAIAEAVRTGPEPRELYRSIMEQARLLQVEPPLLTALEEAANEPPQDFFTHQGWVLIALHNAVWQLLHAPNLEEGIINTVMRGGDTDTNAAIAGALLGAVYGIKTVPDRWLQVILHCRPQAGVSGVVHPRPECFWPVDAPALAVGLLGLEYPGQASDEEFVEKMLQAWMFAARKHQGQLYPGTELPYLVHIGSVLLVLLPAIRIGDGWNAELAICCALLHDTVEDTGTSLEEIRNRFGEDVASGVSALTKNKTGGGEDAVRDSLERIRKQPHEIWCVKMADRIANLSEPPAHWTREKCLSYAAEGEMIRQTLRDASDLLDARLREGVERWRQAYS